MATKTTKAAPQGPFTVINPRNIPKGRHIIRDGDVRYFEGDIYTGENAEMWLERKFITDKPPKTERVKRG